MDTIRLQRVPQALRGWNPLAPMLSANLLPSIALARSLGAQPLLVMPCVVAETTLRPNEPSRRASP